MRLVSRSPQSCGHKNPSQLCWYKKTTCRHPDEKQFHPWWMEPPSPFVQYHGHLTVCIYPCQLNQLLSNHVEKADTGRKTRRSSTSGCKIETNEESGIEDCRLASNSAELECILQHRDTWNKQVKFGDLTGMGKPAARDSTGNTASSSQARHSDVNPSSSARILLQRRQRITLVHDNLTTTWQHPRTALAIMRKVYSNVRQKLGRRPEDDMLEIDVNMTIWEIFMSATMKAAVHLGQNYQDNVRTTENTDLEKITQLFVISQDSIKHQSQEMNGTSPIDGHSTPRAGRTLLNDRAVELSTAKVCVFLWVGALSGQICWVSTVSDVLERQNWVVHAVSRISWIGPRWWSTSRDRVENFPRTHNAAVTSGNPKNDGRKIEFSLNSSEIESSSCRCASTVIGENQETKKFVWRNL